MSFRSQKLFIASPPFLKNTDLCDEDGEGNIVDFDVGPGHVAHETLSTNPGL